MAVHTESRHVRFEHDSAESRNVSVQVVEPVISTTRDTATQVVFKTTNQLLKSEREQMCDLFLRVFNKTMTMETFERKFLRTPKGYSYHGLMLHGETIVGALSAIPARYRFFDEERIFSLSVDTMIAPEYRGGGHILQMAKLMHQGLAEDGVPFIFGFPNKLFYPVQRGLLRYQDIGELDYYVLPLNVGALVRKLRLFNGLSRSFCKWALRFSRVPGASQIRCNIDKVADARFEQHRYDGSYSRIPLAEGAECICKVYEEDGGIRTLYIIDVRPLTPASLAKAVKHAFKAARDAADIIMYVGKLPMKPAGLWKVPDSKKPRKIRMTGKILIPGSVDDSIFDIRNWCVNLSDFDVR